MENAADPSAAHHNHGASSGHEEHGASMQHHGMKMFFHFGCEEVLLFEGWQITTVGQLIGSCIAVFIFGLIFEAIKYTRGCLLLRETPPLPLETVEVEGPDGKVRVMSRNSLASKICSRTHATQTVLHVVQFIVGYALMLIFMTYNVWLCLAVTLGIGIGYFIFGWEKRESTVRRSEMQNGDCCH